MKINLSIAVFTAIFLSNTADAASTTYEGVTFPQGDVSFADKVISYSPGPDVGGSWAEPANALGVPDNTDTSLGDEGSLTVQFTDNSLTTSGDNAADLWIFEGGAVVEKFIVSISTNMVDWIMLGSLSGQPTGIDIDAIAGVTPGQKYSYVKLDDDPTINQTGYPYGEADIDAIGAISSAPPVPEVPLPATALLLAPALLGFFSWRRRFN